IVIISAASPAELALSDATPEVREGVRSAEAAKPIATGVGTAAALSHAPATKPDPQRWSEVLCSFARATVIERDDAHTWAQLKALLCGNELISQEPTRPEKEELVAREADQLEIYYRGLWSACSLEEKVTLFHVAKDGLVGRLDPSLRPLMLRGLIVREPS